MIGDNARAVYEQYFTMEKFGECLEAAFTEIKDK